MCVDMSACVSFVGSFKLAVVSVCVLFCLLFIEKKKSNDSTTNSTNFHFSCGISRAAEEWFAVISVKTSVRVYSGDANISS